MTHSCPDRTWESACYIFSSSRLFLCCSKQVLLLLHSSKIDIFSLSRLLFLNRKKIKGDRKMHASMARVFLKAKLVNNCVWSVMLKWRLMSSYILSKLTWLLDQNPITFITNLILFLKAVYKRRTRVFFLALLAYKRCIMVAIGINFLITFPFNYSTHIHDVRPNFSLPSFDKSF